MLSVQENEELTGVGSGTPMGELLRRYWWPVAASAELVKEPTRPVRILGEDLVLFKDKRGKLGLIGRRCAHRGVDMKWGIPQEDGLLCMYHGWKYDAEGRCLDQLAEPPEKKFHQNVRLPAYPVQELGGLVWAYLGPKEAPLLPRWALLVWDDAFRHIGGSVLNCNWLQCQENSVDQVHVTYAHGLFGMYMAERRGASPEEIERWRRVSRPHLKIGFDVFEHGIIKRRLHEGQSEDVASWRVGHPLVFPNMVYIGLGPSRHEFQIRVPMDDTHTWHLSYQVFQVGRWVEFPKQEPVPYYEIPADPNVILGQDLIAWESQGEITDRTQERLGWSDQGLVLFRHMLKQQMEIVRDGGDPMNVFRDPHKNVCIEMPIEDYGSISSYEPGSVRHGNTGEYSPVIGELDDLLTKAAQAGR